MHGTEGMAVVHPDSRLPETPHIHTFPSSIVKKNYEPYVHEIDHAFEDEFDDGDDFSDHDSHYSEDLPDDLDPREIIQKVPDITRQLLDFTDMVNADIQKFFGRNKHEEDSCDIYEDKWMPTKSGRELYYADLLRVAQGDGESNTRSRKNQHSPLFTKDDVDNRHKFSGRLDREVGLGPLGELFDSILEKEHKFKRLKRMKFDDQRVNDGLPMNERNFPTSFWREPGKQSDPRSDTSAPGILQSSRPPDFSDLLQNWTGGNSDFSEEIANAGSMENSTPTVIQSL